MRWLWRIWRRNCEPPGKLAGLHIRLYTRSGCHLCEAASQVLAEQQRHYGFTLESLDVDSDAALTARYGDWVPVVHVNGKERFRGRVDPVLLTRLLRGEADRARRRPS
jgi:glutaredoxin